MFVSGPSLLQPFAFGPVGAFGFPAGFVHDADQQPRRRPHGYFPSQEVRQPRRRRAPAYSSHPQFHPRYTAGYPWATPGHHYHQPHVDMYYDSDEDDSASEECEEYVHPSHFPARTSHYPSARPVSSSSSSHRAQAGYGEPSQHYWQPQPGRRQPSPFAAQPHVCQPDPAAHTHADCFPAAQRAHVQRQQQQPFSRSFCPLQARQQAHAAAQQAHAAAQQAHAAAQQAYAAPAAAAAADTGAKQGREGSRHVPVSGPRTPSPTTQQSQQQVRPAVCQPVRPCRQLTKAQAATVIQSWWRMRRLARQEAALHALVEANVQLKQVASKFEAYTAEASSSSSSSSSEASKQAGPSQHGFLSHKQYLELNELAMRVLLALDCTPCGVPELRAVRKRLAANAVALLDKIQASFSATVTASMEVPDSVVDDALQRLGSKADAAQPGSSQQQQQEEEEAAIEDGWVPVEDVFEDCDDSAAAAAAAFDPEVSVADADMSPAPCDAVVDMEVVTPVRVVLKVAGQSCDAGTQTD